MAEIDTPNLPIVLRALCEAPHGTFPVAIDRLTPDGCTAEAPAEWEADFDFLRFTLAGAAEINGRVVHRAGKLADIRFFGQIHPCVVAALTGEVGRARNTA